MIRQRHHPRFLLEYLRHLVILLLYHQVSMLRGVQLLHHRISDKPAGVETYLSKLLQAILVIAPGTKFLSLLLGSVSLQPAISPMRSLPRSMFFTIYCGE